MENEEIRKEIVKCLHGYRIYLIKYNDIKKEYYDTEVHKKAMETVTKLIFDLDMGNIIVKVK